MSKNKVADMSSLSSQEADNDDMLHGNDDTKNHEKTSNGGDAYQRLLAQQIIAKPKIYSIDSFFNLYGKFVDKSVFTDRGIKLVQWTMWLFSRLTANNKNIPGHLSPSLRKMYSELSMTRYILRFYGFPSALDAVRASGSWAGAPPYAQSWKDKRIVRLSNIMAWSMLFYYPLEHMAYANWTMPKLFRRVNGNKMSAWSCRLWLIYIVSDLASSFLKNCELQDYKQQLLSQGKEGDNETVELVQIDKCIKMNRIQIARNFFFTPPCLTWSLDKWATDPLLSENVVNGMSWAEAVLCFYQSILSL